MSSSLSGRFGRCVPLLVSLHLTARCPGNYLDVRFSEDVDHFLVAREVIGATRDAGGKTGISGEQDRQYHADVQ